MSIACNWCIWSAGWLPREENNWSLVSVCSYKYEETVAAFWCMGAESKGMKEKWQRRMSTVVREARAIIWYRQGVSNLHIATVPICLYGVALK
jgi:hypothetical protein